MGLIKKLFRIQDVKDASKKTAEVPLSEWIEFEKQKPPHEVVLAACDTYDCGWVIHTVWWYEDKQCWMTTGAVKSTEAHLSYTHWRELPLYPNKK